MANHFGSDFWLATDSRSISPLSFGDEMVSRVDDVLSTRRAPFCDDGEDEEEEPSFAASQPPQPPGRENDRDPVQAELREWALISRDLRQFGLPSVEVLRSSGSTPGLLLDLPQSETLRSLLRTLMSDCDRRQSLLQDILVANNDMKAELKRQTTSTHRMERKAKDLKNMLETSARRIQELSEERAMSEGLRSSEGDRQKNTKEIAVARVRQMERRNEQLEEEMARLRQKLMTMAKENERRHHRQKELFQQLKQRPLSKKVSPMDEKLLDIIDAYEEQLQALRRERDLLGGGSEEGEVEKDEGSEVLTKGWEEQDVSVNYKNLVKELQRKLKLASDRAAELEEKRDLLKLDLESRPSVRDFHNAQARLRRYEKLLRQHNVDIKSEARSDRQGHPMVYSTEVADLDFLPLKQVRDYLQAVTQELDLKNLDSLVLTAKRHRRLATYYPAMAEFIRTVEQFVESPSAPPLPTAFLSARPEGLDGSTPRDSNTSAESFDADQVHKRHSYMLAVLEFWLDQLSALPELRASLFRLHGLLYPWRTAVEPPGDEVCAIVGFVDSMAAVDPETERLTQPGSKGQELCAENVAQGLVGHFQRLFDCPRLDAVYTRMNDIYGKLSELRTLFSNIAQELNLDRDESPAAVYQEVLALNHQHRQTARGQLQMALGPEELASVMDKLEQYDDFFPTFQQLVDDLLKVLDLDSIDRILPAVKSLKRCVDL